MIGIGMWFALQFLVPVVSSSLICDSNGVLCAAQPLSCVSGCDYLLKYRAASADTTQVLVMYYYGSGGGD